MVASIVDFATLTKHLQRDVSLMSPCFASALVQIGYRTHESHSVKYIVHCDGQGTKRTTDTRVSFSSFWKWIKVKGTGTWIYMPLYDKYLVLNALRHGSHRLTCKQRLEAFMRRCFRFNFYNQDDSTVDQLVADLDDGLFAAVLSNDHHVLRCILPERNTYSYSLRPRRHELVLTTKRDSLETFVKRQLFKDMY